MKIDVRETKYYRIGSFVIIGITLLISALIIFGSGAFFHKKIYVESYFNESVQGLSEGSPVKYRGLQIGHVNKISFVSNVYKTHLKHVKSVYNRYIYVRMVITSDFLSNNHKKTLHGFVEKQVTQGLRVKLALQGLTGNAYLDLNFVDPGKNPLLPIDWRPKYFYIPSAKSNLTRFSDNVQHILDDFSQINFKEFFKDLQSLSYSTSLVMGKLDHLLLNTHAQAERVVDDLQYISENFRAISNQAKAYPSQLLFGKPPDRLDPKIL